jgi:hypothetical protein
MTVSRIEIENIKRHEHLALDLTKGKVLVIRGGNRKGKTAIIEALMAMVEGGSKPSLIREWCNKCGHGPGEHPTEGGKRSCTEPECACANYDRVAAKKGTVRLELSNSAYFFKEQTAKGANLKYFDEHGEELPAAKTILEGLAASFSFNPLGFIKAGKKERADFAAQHANLTFTGKEIGALKFGKLDVAGVLRDLIGPDAKLDLDAFDKLRKTVYERRKTANGAVAELDKTVANLRRSLPAEVEQGVTGEDVLVIKRGELQKLVNAKGLEIGEIEAECGEYLATVQKEYEDAVAAAAKARDDAKEAALIAKRDAVEEIEQKYAPQRDELQRAIGEAEGNLKRAGEIKALSAHLEEQKTRLAEKTGEAEKLDQALTALDELKKSRFDKFPVSGVTFKDGECFRDDIPFDQLNKQRQVVTAMEIGCLGMGELPFFVIDEGENFDETNLESVCKDLEASGVQVVITVVSDGPLRAEPQGSLLTS